MNLSIVQQIQRRRRLVTSVIGKRLRMRRKARLPKQQQPDTIRMSYFRALQTLLARAHGLVSRRVLPMLPGLVEEGRRLRGDTSGWEHHDSPKDVNDELDRISEDFYAATSPTELEALAASFGKRTSEFQKEQLSKQVRAAVGVEVPLTDKHLGPRIQAFTAENVALIKSVPQRYFDQVERAVIAGVREGDRWEDIAVELEERFGVAESSAKLIARDQVGKFYGELNGARQQELGVEGYIWRTSNDSRVRDEHAEREGERFSWDSPPEDGHPGSAINCRCSAEADLTAIFESL